MIPPPMSISLLGCSCGPLDDTPEELGYGCKMNSRNKQALELSSTALWTHTHAHAHVHVHTHTHSKTVLVKQQSRLREKGGTWQNCGGKVWLPCFIDHPPV